MQKEICFYCKKQLKLVTSKYKGMEFDTLQCPKCKKQVFNEEMWEKAAIKLEARRLEEEYSRKAIKIGHSWAVTLPKDIVDVFNIKNSRFKIKPDLENKKLIFSFSE